MKVIWLSVLGHVWDVQKQLMGLIKNLYRWTDHYCWILKAGRVKITILKTKFLWYTLNCPLITASGTFGYGECYKDFFAVNELEMLTTKGITLEPRLGNISPRLAEVTAELINSIGLENPGLDYFKAKIVPAFAAFQIPIIVNLNGKKLKNTKY